MNPYDAVPYVGGSFRHTHADHLRTIAGLFGIESAPARQCRVLELGCAAGVNLRQMAQAAPESEFVGIDGSAVQIEQGQEVLRQLNLPNLRLEHADILSLSERQDLGVFDYIVCHGVWSWVPEAVQQAIFATTKALLAPNGVAYISYNTLPGWYQRLQVRDLMRFHAMTFEGPEDQINQARAILGFLAKGSSHGESVYRTLNQHWNDTISKTWNEYIFHEYLAEVNRPVYFKDFVAQATTHALQYLGEAEFSTMVPTDLPDEVQADLERVATDLLRGEQYMDFLRNRTFRRTLLVHTDHTPERSLNWQSLQSRRLSALFSAKDVGELSDTSTAIFHRVADEAPLSIDVPIVKAVLLELADCAPGSVEFDELVRRGQERLGRVQDSDAEAAGTNLLASATRDFIEISTGPRFFTMTVSDRPRVSEVTRRDVRESRYATNLLFQHVAVEPFEQHLLRLCDGAHTHEEMAKKLTVEIDEGLLDVEWKGPRLKGNPDVENIVLSIVKSRLKKLARQGLLLA